MQHIISWSIAVYFDASEACHAVGFTFGNNANGLSTIATRTWNIKVSQIPCASDLLAPQGCTQYYYGSPSTGYLRTFNFDGGRHLADQYQTICVRRERGNCRVCYSADAAADFGTSAKSDKVTNKSDVSPCFTFWTKCGVLTTYLTIVGYSLFCIWNRRKGCY